MQHLLKEQLKALKIGSALSETHCVVSLKANIKMIQYFPEISKLTFYNIHLIHYIKHSNLGKNRKNPYNIAFTKVIKHRRI